MIEILISAESCKIAIYVYERYVKIFYNYEIFRMGILKQEYMYILTAHNETHII